MSSAASRVRRGLVLALGLGAAASVGCRRSKPAPPPAATAGLATCRAALVRVAGLPPPERTAALVRGCPVCGQSFEPLIPAAAGHPDLLQIDQLVAACAPGCSKRALDRWRQLLADVVPDQGVLRPWRALAEDCPAALPTDDATVRYASAPVFALATIGQRLEAARAALPPTDQAALDRERAAIAIPLPPWTVASTGLIAPPGRTRAALPWRHVTITDKQLLVGRLAIGRLDGGWRVDASGPPYPGQPASADLARDLAALGPRPAGADTDLVLVIAPIAAPATRVLDGLRALGDQPAAIAVAVPEATALVRGAVAPHALTLQSPSPAPIRVDLAAGRVAIVDGAGAVTASFALPPGTAAARWAVVVGAAGPRPIDLAAVPAELAVDDLAALLDAAADAGLPRIGVTAADADCTTGDRGPFDPAAFAAQLPLAHDAP